MDWDKGYSSSYYMTVVDPVSWKDTDRIELTGGSINRNASGLMQTADVNCVNYQQGLERYVRIYLDARQSADSAHIPLFTGLATSPDRNIRGSWTENSLQCFSVLKPIDDIILKKGWFAPTGVKGAEIIEQLFTSAPFPVEIAEGSPELNTVIIAEDGETNLTMVERILTAIDWNIRILGDGTVQILPYSNEPRCVFDPLIFDVIETEIQVSSDWYSCPNVFMATNNNETGIAKDESEESILSIPNRGREVWMYENNSAMMAAETIDQYAERRLKEEQRYSITASYNRRFVPDIMPGDYISLHYPSQDLNGPFIVESQSIDLGYAARTSEEIIGVV